MREHREAMPELANKMHVSRPVVERALYIFDKFCNSKEFPFRGKDKTKMDAILVSCLYSAGKQLSQQKPMEEYAQAMDLTLSDIYQAGKIILPFIHAEDAYYLPKPENDRTRAIQKSGLWDLDSLQKSSQGLKAHISRLCHMLGFQFRERKIAEDMALEVVKSLSVRRKPASTAAIIVWICSLLHGREVDLKFLSNNSVSVKTLRQILVYPFIGVEATNLAA